MGSDVLGSAGDYVATSAAMDLVSANMKFLFTFAVGLFAINVPASAFASEQTIRLSVPAMSCASCPYMVTQIILNVDGVITAEATMDDRTATVTYDDERTNVEAITEATASIGFESTLVVGGKS